MSLILLLALALHSAGLTDDSARPPQVAEVCDRNYELVQGTHTQAPRTESLEAADPDSNGTAAGEAKANAAPARQDLPGRDSSEGAPERDPDLATVERAMERLNSDSPVESERAVLDMVNRIEAGENKYLEAVVRGFEAASLPLRRNARSVIARLVVGSIPSNLENRLGDYSEEELKSRSKEIIKQHEDFVEDLRTFESLSSEGKQARINALGCLKKHRQVLSPRDERDIARQLDELSWSLPNIKSRLSSALLMLAFNYHYFGGLNARAQMLPCLIEAMNKSPEITADAVFLDVAKRGLAQTDRKFMELFTRYAGKEFDPSTVP